MISTGPEGGYLDDRRRATWMTPNWMTRELRSHHEVPGLCSKTKQTLLSKK